jgi:hypothetical protein
MAAKKPSISLDFRALLDKYGMLLYPADMAEIWDCEPRSIYRWNKDWSKKRKLPPSHKKVGKTAWNLWDVVDWLKM